MDYVTRISHWIQKQQFGITCPSALFMKTAVGPPELEKYYVGVSRTGMHYVTHRSTRM
jgi:hypothetical protein